MLLKIFAIVAKVGTFSCYAIGVGPFLWCGVGLAVVLGSVLFLSGVGPKINQYIKCFVIPRKRPNERSECDLEQPTY